METPSPQSEKVSTRPGELQLHNTAGPLSWQGRIDGRGLLQGLFTNQLVYHGTWGLALFQSLYQPASGLLSALPSMPEWYAVLAGLIVLSLVGLAWPPLLALAPLAILALGATLLQAMRGAAAAEFRGRDLRPGQRLRLRGLTAWLHLVQPWARLRSRIEHGLGPWRQTGLGRMPTAAPRRWAFWSEEWRDPQARLEQLKFAISRHAPVTVGGTSIGGTSRSMATSSAPSAPSS